MGNTQHTTDDPEAVEDDRMPERAFAAAQAHAYEVAGVDFESATVDIDPPPIRIHVVDVGEPTGEPPLLFVHGVMSFGAMFAPLLGRLTDVRLLVVDRPGWGLSEDYRYDAATHRQTAVDVLAGVLDALDIEQVDIVGHSTGGYWGLVFALARPERVRRLVALGGVPAFPGTTPPLSLRLFTVPMLARLLLPRGHPTEDTVVEQFAIVGEQETITRYPELVATRVAHDRNPRYLATGVAELRSFMSLRRWRAEMRLSPDELRGVEHPTTFVWPTDDLLGAPETVREPIESMPNARLETLPGGHLPWLGHPEECAAFVSAGRA